MIWHTLWLVLAGLIGLLWAVRLVAVETAMRRRCMLDESSYNGPPESAPQVSIVLAGKDEEDNIERCIRSLLQQDYPNFELIAVDDRSTDETPKILARLQREFQGRLQTLRVTELPPGWFGKHNAVRLGMERASGQWLLFTDADCRQTSSRSLSLAMSEALHHKADFLSVLPNLERPTFWERVLQPVCAAILMVWFRPARVNDPKTPAAYANGAFMLMSRKCYDAIGGHHAVRDKINEDVHMAAIAKQSGQRLRVVENRGLYVARMYDSPAAAFRGWSRIFYGCLVKPSRIAVALLLVFFGGVVPWTSLIAATMGMILYSNEGFRSPAIAWGLVVILIQLVTARLYHKVGYGAIWSLTYAPGAVVGSAILFNALLKSLGLTQTTWRRTTYQSSLSRKPLSSA